MKQLFTEHVRALMQGGNVSDDFLESLRDVLRQELRRRGVLDLVPRLLGYTGKSWRDPEPIEDLLHDCYIFAISSRLRGLKEQLKLCANIDGFVLRNIRNFLTEKQRLENPARYALFKNLEAALTELIASSVLKIDFADDDRISADCIFHVPEVTSVPPVREDIIREATSASQEWHEAVKSLGKQSHFAQEQARTALQKMIDSGIKSFRLRNLIDALALELDSGSFGKRATDQGDRIWDDNDEGIWQQIRTVCPDTGYEEKEQFNALIERMRQAIDKLDRLLSVRRRICRVFDFFIRRIESGDDMKNLKYADAINELGIAKSTLSDDIKTLRRVAKQVSG